MSTVHSTHALSDRSLLYPTKYNFLLSPGVDLSFPWLTYCTRSLLTPHTSVSVCRTCSCSWSRHPVTVWRTAWLCVCVWWTTVMVGCGPSPTSGRSLSWSYATDGKTITSFMGGCIRHTLCRYSSIHEVYHQELEHQLTVVFVPLCICFLICRLTGGPPDLRCCLLHQKLQVDVFVQYSVSVGNGGK